MGTAKNPIIEAVFDIWFESAMPSEVLLGVILDKIEEYKTINKLPLLQVPENIRKSDPNLKSQPLYEISAPEKNYKITLGDNLLGLAIKGDYLGWSESYYDEIKMVFKTIFDTNRISNINRMGMRYIDFFTDNIFIDSKVDVRINNEPETSEKLFLKKESLKEKYINTTLVIGNDMNIMKDGKQMHGSIIDTVVAIEERTVLDNAYSDFEQFMQIADQMHRVNKEEFKKVISDELSAQLGL